MNWGCTSWKWCHCSQLFLGDCLSPTIQCGEHDSFIYSCIFCMTQIATGVGNNRGREKKPVGMGPLLPPPQREMEHDVLCFSSFAAVWRIFMRGDSVWQSEFSSLSVKLLAWEVCRTFWDLGCSDRSNSINSPLALHELLSSLLLGRSIPFTVLEQGSWWHWKQSKKTFYEYCSATAQAQK